MHKFAKFLVLIGVLVPQLVLAQTNSNAIVEDAVRFYFADAPIMIDIARCETGFRQFKSDGTPLYDPSGTYIGIFQISELLHTPKALSMGFDLRTIDGNLGFARYLYNSSGTGPWKGCLPKTTTTPVAPTPATPTPVPVSSTITANLRMGQTSPQVLLVQQILNRNGFIITQSGGGSPGNETSYFGSLTREAVRRFQCTKGIVCSGTEATTGYGRVGPATRSALNSL